MGILQRIKRPLAPVRKALKLGLAGQDIEELLRLRDRRRLGWLARDADDPVLRFRALRALAEIMDPEAAPLFLTSLDQPAGELEPAVLRVAIEGLGRLQHMAAAPALRRSLAPNRPLGINLAAARSLALLGRDEDWEAVRRWATQADDASLIPDERDAVSTTEPGPTGLRPLIWVLQSIYADKDASWWTRKAASWLRSDERAPRIAGMRGAGKVVASNLRGRLERLDLNEQDFVRQTLHLGNLAEDRDQQQLQRMATQDAQGPRRRAALLALGLHGDPRSTPVLAAGVDELSPDDSEGAADLARALGRGGWPDAVIALGNLRERWDGDVLRCNVAWSLGEIGGEAAVRQLMHALRERRPGDPLPETELRWIAVALRRCGRIGRESLRGGLAIAKAAHGERDRLRRATEIAGLG